MPVDATLSSLAEQQLVTAIVQALTAEGVRLALVVAPGVGLLARVAQALHAASGWESVEIGPMLSGWLLAQDGPLTPRLLRQGVQTCLAGRESPAICTDLDLLFEPALQLEPFALLRHVSRQRGMVACWPGTFTDGVLAYAVPEHAHYRTWINVTEPELHIFPIP